VTANKVKAITKLMPSPAQFAQFAIEIYPIFVIVYENVALRRFALDILTKVV
jgi:hypothetical protein